MCAVPWGCSVPWEISWVPWGISWVPWECSVPWGDIMINVGGYFEYRGEISWVPWRVILSTMGDVQYHGGYHDAHGGYHEYRRGCLARYWTPPTVLHTHYTGWKSYKIQGDCQVFSIFKKLFIFIKLKVLDDTLFHGFREVSFFTRRGGSWKLGGIRYFS